MLDELLQTTAIVKGNGNARLVLVDVRVNDCSNAVTQRDGNRVADGLVAELLHSARSIDNRSSGRMINAELALEAGLRCFLARQLQH